MEYLNLELGLIGILGLGAWLVNYLYLFKNPELYLSKNNKSASIKFKRNVVLILGVIAWLFISFSLTGPRKAIGFAKNSIEVNDIFFVVDVSRSMLVKDFSPNRLEAAKKKIEEFVDLVPTDRIGIIMFSEKAYTLLPLSTDLELIKQIISEIKIGFLGSGTNIGDALGLAVGRGAQSLAKNKIIILLTDGVSNVGFMTPLQAAEEAKNQGIKVYTIGIGGDKNAVMPSSRGFFGRQQKQKVPGGSFDNETLVKISNLTGGKHFTAGNSEALSNVLAEIQLLEKTEIDSSGRVVYNEQYWIYLLLGSIFLFLTEGLRKLMLKEGV